MTMFSNNYITNAYYRIYESTRKNKKVVLTDNDCKNMQNIINKAYADHKKKKLTGNALNSLPENMKAKVNAWIKYGRPSSKAEYDAAVAGKIIKKGKNKGTTKPTKPTKTAKTNSAKNNTITELKITKGSNDYDIGLNAYLYVRQKVNRINAETGSLDKALRALTKQENNIRLNWIKLGRPETVAQYNKAMEFVNANMIDKLYDNDIFLRRAASAELYNLKPEQLFERIEKAKTYAPSDLLIRAIIFKESKGNNEAVGDKHLKDHAYGSMQIRKCVLTDVNKNFNTHYTEADFSNRAKSVDMFKKYTKHWWAYDDESAARIWNGGPDGCYEPETVEYWNEVKANMKLPNINKISLT